MKTIAITAPEFDKSIGFAISNPVITDREIIRKLELFFETLRQLKSVGDDEARSFWIELPRGTIDNFGTYQEYFDEGMVSTKEELTKYWKESYPEKTKWYRFAAATYNNEYYFYVDSKLVAHIKPTENEIPVFKGMGEFIQQMSVLVSSKLQNILIDVSNYNKHVTEQLPYQKRYGRILRSDYWELFGHEKKTFKKNITPEMVEIIKQLADKPNKMIEKFRYLLFTSGQFFRICALGYDANNYFNKKGLDFEPVRKYDMMADGRDCGLKEIDPDSAAAFLNWFQNETNCGGHPWEICRGGNSTHISLYVKHENKSWSVVLAGSACTRVVETVKMAAAFYKNNVPFELRDAEAIYRMITGTDYIGIVPETVFPRYCHSLFPKEDKIVDFMQLRTKKKAGLIKKAYWYPEEMLTKLT